MPRRLSAFLAAVPFLIRHGVALFLICLALLLTWSFQPLTGQIMLLFFYAAVVVSAWYGGLGPSLLATAGAVVSVNYFLVAPSFSLRLGFSDLLELVVFTLVALLTSSLTAARQRAEAAAREQSQRLQVTFTSISDAVIATDTQGRVTFLNPAAERLSGWTSRQAIGRGIAEVCPILATDTRQPLEHPIARVLREGRAEELPDQPSIVVQGGAVRAIEGSVAPIRDDAGVVLGAVLVARDVTARTQAEHERAQLLAREQTARMAAEEARYRFAFLAEVSAVLNASLDDDVTLTKVADLSVPRFADWCAVDVTVEDGTIRRLAVAHVDPAKVAWADDLHRRYPLNVSARMGVAEALRSGRSTLYTDVSDAMLEAVASDAEHVGSLRTVGFVSVIIVPLLIRGAILGAISFATAESGRRYEAADLELAEEVARRAALAIDNARLYAAEQQARASAERAADWTARLQAVTARLSEALTPVQVAEVIVTSGLAAFDADAGAVYALADEGRAFQALSFIGYPSSLAQQYVRFSASAPGMLREAVQSQELVLVESPEILVERWPHLAEAQHRSGDAATAAVPLVLDQRVLGVLYVAFRAPRLFSVEDRAFLTTLARQCTQALERARLYEAEQLARAEAQEAVHLRDVFLSVASHELKTPLTSLLGNGQLLQRRAIRDGELNARNQHLLQVVVDQAIRLRTMVDALLDISRIETGHLSIQRLPLDLGALARRVVAEVQPALEQHTLVCESPDTPLLVEGDELRLEQVLQNLIQNAFKYSPAGGLVTVRVERQGDRATVAVTDHGIGIPTDALPHLFQRFYRATNADPQRISGLGVGLYMSREIVALHGGSITVVSSEGSGSTFTVALPLGAAVQTAADPLLSSAEGFFRTLPAQTDEAAGD